MAQNAQNKTTTLVSTYDYENKQFRLVLWQGTPTQLDDDTAHWSYKIFGNDGYMCYVRCRDKKLPEQVAREWLRALYRGERGETINLTTGKRVPFVG